MNMSKSSLTRIGVWNGRQGQGCYEPEVFTTTLAFQYFNPRLAKLLLSTWDHLKYFLKTSLRISLFSLQMNHGMMDLVLDLGRD